MLISNFNYIANTNFKLFFIILILVFLNQNLNLKLQSSNITLTYYIHCKRDPNRFIGASTSTTNAKTSNTFFPILIYHKLKLLCCSVGERNTLTVLPNDNTQMVLLSFDKMSTRSKALHHRMCLYNVRALTFCIMTLNIATLCVKTLGINSHQDRVS